MNKSTLAKWAFAALMAVPAVPMFGKTLHHKTLIHRSGHSVLVSTAARRHLAHKTTRHVAYSTRSGHRSLFTSRSHRSTLTHKTTRHTSLKRTPSFKVHVTKMPPTIDGINA